MCSLLSQLISNRNKLRDTLLIKPDIELIKELTVVDLCILAIFNDVQPGEHTDENSN